MKSICTLAVKGMDLECPLCGALVKDGHGHTCKVDEETGEIDERTYALKKGKQ